MKKRGWKWFVAVGLLSAAAGGGVYAWRMRLAYAATALPSATVRKGAFQVVVRCRGELRARNSAQLVAPLNVPELRIVWMAPTGSRVQEGDVVVRFDPSRTKQQLAEKLAVLKQAQAALDQSEAEARITAEQDRRTLSEARFQVERVKLDVSLAEIVSALKAEESKIELKLSEKRLAAQSANAELNAASSKAKIASLARQRDKAKEEVDITQQRLGKMELKAPLSGLIVYLANYSQGWMNAKPFKVGDQVWPGGAVAEIPDLESMEMEGKLEEIDRGQIAEDQEVTVRVDSLPETPFRARLVQISPMTVMGFDWPPTRTFRGFARIEKADQRLRPGMNGAMDVVVQQIPDAISIPAKALFTKDGKPVVFVATRGRYEMREVKVLARNPDEIAVEGVSDGTNVTTVEPGQKEGRGT